MQDLPEKIPVLPLDVHFYNYHKKIVSNFIVFACDNSHELIENQFCLYSSANLKEEVSPTKNNFYRIAICRQGSFKIKIDFTGIYSSKRDDSFYNAW